jgi:hypothetical protein
MALHLMSKLWTDDVLITESMFGDILPDLAWSPCWPASLPRAPFQVEGWRDASAPRAQHCFSAAGRQHEFAVFECSRSAAIFRRSTLIGRK